VRPCINLVTLGEKPFPVAVEACAAGGFECIEVWLPYVERFIADGHSMRDARSVLDDCGVEAVAACYVDGLFGPAGNGKREAFDLAKTRFEICEHLGVGTIACVGGCPLDALGGRCALAVDRSREVGELADSFGLTVAIEFLARAPFLGTLAAAAELVEQVDRPNVGILLDTFHFHAGGSTMADFGLVGRRGIVYVHLSDAPDVPRSMLTDAQRVLPGQGCFPWPETLARLEQAGYDGFCSVELFNPALWSMEPAEVARRARGACDAWLA